MQDMTGLRFGLLTVIEKTKDESGRSIWKCQCDCGGIAYVQTGHLNAGTTKSCGCLQREKQKDLTGQRFGKHDVLGCDAIESVARVDLGQEGALIRIIDPVSEIKIGHHKQLSANEP